MRPFRDFPIRRKLLLLLIAPSAVTLLLAIVAIVAWDQFLFRQRIEREMGAVADIIASNSAAALSANDERAASSTLSSLSAKPHVISGCIYGPGGKVVAAYVRAGEIAGCPSAPAAAARRSGEMGILRPVVLGGRPLGTLLLRYDLGELGERLVLFGVAVSVLLVASALAGLLFSTGLRRSIALPILTLADTARSVSQTKNYSLRAQKLSGDETAALVDGFNEMLSAVQLRDAEVRRARDELEQRVLRRTEQLRRSEERFRAVTETAHDAIILGDQHGTIIYWNQGAERIFGYPAEEAVGQPLTLIMPERLHAAHRQALRQYVQTREAVVMGKTLEMVGRRSNGTEFPAELSLASWEIGAEMYFTGLLRDITDRKQADAALRESEERFRLVVERVKDYAIFMLDPLGRVATWNTGAERILGWRAEEIVGQHFSRFHPAGEIECGKPEQEIQMARSTGRTEDEGWRIRKDGSRFWGNSILTALRDGQGRLVGFSKITRDLSGRREAEAALRQRASLLDLTHEAILVRDMQNRITLWNRGAEEAYGWSGQEAVGKSSDQLLRTQYPQPPEEIERAVLSEGRWEGELVQSSRWGSRIMVDSRWALQRDEHGAPAGVLIFNRDVTGRRRAEEALKLQAEELARSNTDLQQFAYVASHDLQEPLRMVISYMQLLEADYKGKLSPDADEFIGFAVDGAMRMRQLIRGLLAYSRAGSGGLRLEPTDCAAVLDEVRSNLQVAIRESGAEISSDGLPVLVTDPLQMLQLFQNLVNNALIFRGPEPPRIRVSAVQTGSRWLFFVADNGIGIAPQHFERIFGIFQRLHDRMHYQGTGIGLAICKKIVERRGGRIWVESQPGKGSTFYFTIPIEPLESTTGNLEEKSA